MTTHRLSKGVRPVFGLLLIVACVAATTAGGFQLRVDVPQDDSDVVVLVRTYRCHQPEKAKVSGTAEGLVDGQRVSVPLTLKTVDKGVYSVEWQWSARGAWVLAFSGSYAGHHTSTVVTLDDQGKVAAHFDAWKEDVDGEDVHVMSDTVLEEMPIEEAMKHFEGDA